MEKKEMGLLDIPKKLIEDEVLQLLDWNDILRLRRVCDKSVKITNGYLQANPGRAPEIEISEEKDKSFGAFLEMGIPTTKLFINNANSGHRFYENEEDKRRQFLEDYGPLITHLRVTEMTLANNAMCRDMELTFMEGLSNLKSLEVQYCVSGRSGAELTEEDREPTDEEMGINLVLPETFKKLEKVKVGRDLKHTDLWIMERKKRTSDFLMQCVHLKSISFPTSWLSPYPERTECTDGTVLCTNGTLPGDLRFLLWSFEQRPNRFGYKIKSEANLEIIDFENCHEGYGEWLKDNWQISLPFNFHGSKLFMDLCSKCKEMEIKLSNVSPYWFYAKDAPHVDGTKEEEWGLGGDQVISLVGLDPTVMEVEMPNLERITIPSTNYCVTGGKRAEWPKLKILDITVDGNEGFCWDFVGVTDIHRINGKIAQGTDNMFQFLFWDVSRPSVEELYLKFEDDGGRKKNKNSGVPSPFDGKGFLEEGKKLKWGMEEMLTVPNTTSILKCCANLKVLKLGNWPGTNQALLVFWNGLGGTLEEVELEGCGNLADFAFFGEEDGEKSVFLKLKKLKKLALKGLDKMEKVTDRLFTGILAKMELKQLVLTSDKPLEKVTKDGIGSLLEGPFAETIEKFSFKGWSLANVTPKEFEDLGKKFRSYNML